MILQKRLLRCIHDTLHAIHYVEPPREGGDLLPCLPCATGGELVMVGNVSKTNFDVGMLGVVYGGGDKSSFILSPQLFLARSVLLCSYSPLHCIYGAHAEQDLECCNYPILFIKCVICIQGLICAFHSLYCTIFRFIMY